MADAAPCVTNFPARSQRPSPERPREEDSESEDEPRQFRRVRIRCRQQARKQSSAGGTESGTLKSGSKRIRCICGVQKDLDLPGNDSDYEPSATPISAWLIQCRDCKFWQHRSCIGAENGNDPLGGFYCEQCPRLGFHHWQAPRNNAPWTAANAPCWGRSATIRSTINSCVLKHFLHHFAKQRN